VASLPSSGSAVWSSRREVMPSFVNTLRRCRSTVRELRNSSAPISGFGRPSLARQAICRSRGGQLVTRRLGALVDRLPGGQQLAAGAVGERLGLHRGEHLVGGPQLDPGISSPVPASEPFPVDEMSTSKGHGAAATAELLDRLTVQKLGVIAVADKRARARFDALAPRRTTVPRRACELLDGASGAAGIAAAGRCLHQFDQAPVGKAEFLRCTVIHGSSGIDLSIACICAGLSACHRPSARPWPGSVHSRRRCPCPASSLARSTSRASISATAGPGVPSGTVMAKVVRNSGAPVRPAAPGRSGGGRAG
jgi:hypothetical protein